ncbi:1-(5-phosphoribosyl)-5-[(5-phosphoribosylamino)methylideneamino]imidazole-4-carboxamide isomerase [Flintibacter sp. KGMB00164]|uniref:1-(5-phosphoribosyl)-5-[(5- phosphoribosylamino)methylideneamino]imidazole-4- carboxamide isomerase n=1 Tax=Flintibacter sp. KGMB00164 TaxID=2610895 RepID=UPI0012440B61|nr:1-(5-phosphoribosyl)-5-[(5-phosphoribosylamino)methylideneamino]imidazole-4-carboxamide isomerase [Flintibacter sp. KGMB00164]
MILLPAIDLYEKKVVRLTRGDYAQMTVYNDNPVAQAKLFQDAGAQWLHTVDLEGAKDGSTPNYSVIEAICKDTNLKVEIGGGIRSLDTIQKYLDAGVERVILGTKAVTDPAFLEESLDKFGSHIAVGVDIKDGKIAIKGWLETAQDSVEDFFTKLCKLGVSTVICTDVSKDGMLAGTNVDLYRQLSQKFSLDLIASGGVSSQEDLTRLKALGLYGAILGKALYTGALDLKTALKEMEG